MGKERNEHLASYKPMPYQSRFWLYSEHCYSEDELHLREVILKARLQSGIDPDYLNNPGTWFVEDTIAFINVYDNAWFYSPAFKPHQLLSHDDLYIHPVDSQRLQWPGLYELMQRTGDYLLLRNQNLPDEHLNQPMNFFFLDLNNILKGLSQNTNIEQVKTQLELITRYIRNVEKNISPLVGSDRLFLANVRSIIDDEIHPQLSHMIESKLLRERLNELAKTIKKISFDRNRILHFALNTNQVNHHSYEFSLGALKEKKSFPTQAAKSCSQTSTVLVADLAPVLHLTANELKTCPDFELISMDEDILNHYAKAISDLNELERFQMVINQIMDLLGQAGEVYTVQQFKEQMLILFEQINGFIEESSVPINAIIDANTQAYHKAIETEQNLSFWEKKLSNKQRRLQNFIKNQDILTLPEFPSNNVDLTKTNKLVKEYVNQVINHLNHPQTGASNFAAISGQVQQLDKLMGSMHQWIQIYHEIKGLPAPHPPQLLSFAIKAQDSTTNTSIQEPIHYPQIFNPPSATQPYPAFENSDQCPANLPGLNNSQNAMIYLGLLSLIPLGVIIMLFIYQWYKPKEIPVYGTADEFNAIKTRCEDLLAQIKGIDQPEDSDYDDFIDSFTTLVNLAQTGKYNVEALKQLLEDLNYHYQNTFVPLACMS